MRSNIKLKKGECQEKKKEERKEKSKSHFGATYPQLKEITASLWGKSSAFTSDIVRSAATHLQCLTASTATNHHHTTSAGQEQDGVFPAALDFMVRGDQ